jgi:uncharacterized protein YbbC (DUF1343 family)
MSRRSLVKLFLSAVGVGALTLMLGCAGCSSKTTKVVPKPTPPPVVVAPPPALPPEKLPPVMLGIDVLEADGFKAVAGKKIGLLTHRAGVNRRGESTINVLLRAPATKLVALFAPEHGLDGEIKASVNFGDSRHVPTGLPIYSLHGDNRKPTAKQLQGLDALVIDLQDIGVRSYTFNVVMRYAMDACFQYGVEVIVLDRPNPLGGLKVDGPPLDEGNMSGVGAFPRMPYVHGLTIGEIALMAKHGSSAISGMVPVISEKVRDKGKLTVIPLRGWSRNMLWPDTELKWVVTSPMVTSYDAVIGYAMVGLGCEQTPWSSGIGREFPFRGISYPKKTPDEIISALNAYKIPGIRLVKREGRNAEGKPVPGVYVEVSDWEKWNPTELSLYMHKQAEKWSTMKLFGTLPANQQRSFRIHVGSTDWLNALKRDGMRVDVPRFLNDWTARAKIYQDMTKKFWLYPWGETPAGASKK